MQVTQTHRNFRTDNAAEGRSTTIIPSYYFIIELYSLLPLIIKYENKYLETEGIKDLGENFWNVGKTKEIRSRVMHL
jgi:hypothetical protein